jgi:hypothetical protein
MAKKKNEELAGDSDGGDYEEEPNFDDPEGFVDNITDEGIYFIRIIWQKMSTFQSIDFMKINKNRGY